MEQWGLKPAAHGILVDKETFQTNLPGVFAAGNAIRAKGLVVRSVADGREAAAAIDEYLRRSGTPVVCNAAKPDSRTVAWLAGFRPVEPRSPGW